MISCTRRVQFAAGHRVLNHESKCANMHGHNYVALFEAQEDQGSLDSIGRVIDFSVLKEKLGGWIDRNWDHGFIVFEEDAQVKKALQSINGQKRFVAPFNPTAEEMSIFLLRSVGPQVLAGTGIKLIRVTIWETENCFAVADLQEPPRLLESEDD